MTALGFGAAIGVVTLLWLQRRVPRDHGVLLRGRSAPAGFLVLAASFSALAPAGVHDRRVSARARAPPTSPASPCCRRRVADELRGRTFATLYTVVRLCLLISLTISPLWADFWDWVTASCSRNQSVSIGPYGYALPGVRIALWGGGSSRSSRACSRGARSGARNVGCRDRRTDRGRRAARVRPARPGRTVAGRRAESRPEPSRAEATIRRPDDDEPEVGAAP